MEALKKTAVTIKPMRKNIMGYEMPDGRWLHVLAEGRLVNLAAGDGHPAEIMDMSFAIQFMSVKYLAEHKGRLTDIMIAVPEEIDTLVAERKLKSLGKSIDVLTEEQQAYINS